MRVLLITGLSGAGKSVALKTLEDIGCEAIDNAPLSVIPSLVASGGDAEDCLAIGADARSRDFSPEHFEQILAELKANPAHEVRLVFLDADSETLQRRF